MAIILMPLPEDIRLSERRDISRVMSSALLDRYRCPEEFLQFELVGRLSADSGYFRFGPAAICYGRTSTGYRSSDADALLYRALPDLKTKDSTVLLPFNPTEVIDNLRFERYAKHSKASERSWRIKLLRDTYYRLRPVMGLDVRRHVQRLNACGWQRAVFPSWPVDTSVEQLSEALLLAAMKARKVDRMPFVWFWPKDAESCVVMTHDVEGQKGYDFCRELMDIDDAHHVRSSFQFVPEGAYKISAALIEELRGRGFEVNIQDLNHDGYLLADRGEFLRRVQKINQYGRIYGARGFRAAVLYRNLNWYDSLDFAYDMSVPNVAHLDPQRGGCCTVMPYFVDDLLEMPLTTTQDYTLFHLLGDYSLGLWKSQVASIRARHGLVMFLAHPDYIFDHDAMAIYRALLAWLRELAALEPIWFALPSEVNQWWRARSKMHVLNYGGEWRIEGPESERATLAFAKVSGDHIEYEFASKVPVVRGQGSCSTGVAS